MLKRAVESDRNDILNYCKAEPSINIFIVGDIENHGFDAPFQEVWIQLKDSPSDIGNGGKNQEAITGIALRYHDNFILYSRDLDMNYPEILDLMLSKTVNIISGKKSVIDAMYLLVEADYSKREMTFYELKEPVKLCEPLVEVQLATEQDAKEISEAYGEIAEFSGLYSGDSEQRYHQIAQRIISGEGVHFIIRENGKLVCHGNTTAETSISAMIGGVFTLPVHRNKGLGSQIVSALSNYLLSKNKVACLFYDNPNNSIFFERLGFGVIENWTVLGRK